MSTGGEGGIRTPGALRHSGFSRDSAHRTENAITLAAPRAASRDKTFGNSFYRPFNPFPAPSGFKISFTLHCNIMIWILLKQNTVPWTISSGPYAFPTIMSFQTFIRIPGATDIHPPRFSTPQYINIIHVNWRKGWDSNPRCLAALRFSRPVL